MECKNIKPLLIDFVDKKLTVEKTQLVKEHLKKCKSCREELDDLIVLIEEMSKIGDEKPDESLRMNFEMMIEDERKKIKSKHVVEMKTQSTPAWLISPFGRIAAGFALLISGVLLGLLLNRDHDSNTEMAGMKNELNQMKEMLILTKLELPSASQRILATNYIDEIDVPDDNILIALIKTMNNDPNANVRMAALNALSKFKGQHIIRDALVESLSIQTDPIIQISLINLLIELQEKRAVEKMKKLLENTETNESVKRLAQSGIVTII